MPLPAPVMTATRSAMVFSPLPMGIRPILDLGCERWKMVRACGSERRRHGSLRRDRIGPPACL